MNNCVVYARVSTLVQARKGISIDAQIAFCKEYAQKNGLVVKHIFTDISSGKNNHRPGIQKVLSLINSEDVQHLLITRLDRLSRETSDTLHVTKQCDKKRLCFTWFLMSDW